MSTATGVRKPSGRPVASVVVPTRNRSARLPGLFDALAAQLRVGNYEVVVVDDASDDDTAAVLERLVAAAPVPVTPVRLERNGGPAAARNAGWRAARAPVVAFTDDDCLPQPGWLAALVARVGAGAELVQGRTLPDPSVERLGRPFHHTMLVERPDPSYPTCNMAYRRETLERLGGFDERFRLPYGEDTDLAWRALESGARAVFEPDALVHHEVTESSFGRRIRHARRMEGTVQAVSRHPGLREVYPYRWFYKASHPPALAALAGLAAAASRPSSPRHLALGAALVLPYLHHRLRVDRPWCRRREWPVYLPLYLVADLADVAMLAAASVRHRTLVL